MYLPHDDSQFRSAAPGGLSAAGRVVRQARLALYRPSLPHSGRSARRHEWVWSPCVDVAARDAARRPRRAALLRRPALPCAPRAEVGGREGLPAAPHAGRRPSLGENDVVENCFARAFIACAIEFRVRFFDSLVTRCQKAPNHLPMRQLFLSHRSANSDRAARGGLDMARVFITGSSDGLGLMAARILIQQGHQVLLHGRHPERAKAALAAAPGAEHAVIGDLSDVEETKRVAEQVNGLGRFDAVIHNAGVGYREPRRIDTQSGASQVFAINVLAPYIVTALIERPDRLVYLSSGMHYGVSPRVDDMLWTKRRWEGASAYAESKFYDVALAFAVARLWPESCPTRWSPDGCRPRWAALARPTT